MTSTNEEKRFKMTSYYIIWKSIFPSMLGLILIFILFITLHSLSGFFRDDLKLGYIGLAYILLLFFVGRYFLKVFKLHWQYLANEKGKTIILNVQKNLLSIALSKYTYHITGDNITRIVFNKSTKQDLTSEYEYVTIETNNAEYHITNLIMPDSALENIFLDTKRIIKFNKVNFL